MLAIIEQWDGESGSHTDNIQEYLMLMLLKVGMDTSVLYLCCWKLNASFLSMCSVSIVVADIVMALFVATLWLLWAEGSPMSPCFLLTFASAAYGALPLPMMCLGIVDYSAILDYCISNRSTRCKSLRNMVLTLLVWMQAGIYAYSSVKPELKEMHNVLGMKVRVCEVKEASPIIYFTLGIFGAVICTMLPFCSRVPRWVIETHQLYEAMDKHESPRSDLLLTSTPCAKIESSKGSDLEGTTQSRPPLWFSLILGFTVFWMPYLIVSVVCLVFAFAVPAYITVNLLWLECTNSVLLGVMFWVKSEIHGPYTNLPENVCVWHIFWYLSKRQQGQLAVFNPGKMKRNPPLHV